MLELKLFGTGQACYLGRPLPGFPSQQASLVLCYLLLNRHHPHHREQLAAVFWSDYPTHTSRKYLRNALWRLRQALQAVNASPDSYLAISDDSVSFLTSSLYALDVETFEETVSPYQDVSGGSLTAEQAASLERAASSYGGDLLEGIYEDWCLYDRERLSLLHLSVLGKLVVFHATHGTCERGIAYGERILAHDNTREKVHRQLMCLHWLAGDRNAALAQYKRCAQILREELGIPPMKQTKLLYEQMLHNRFDPATWPGHHSAPSSGLDEPGGSMQPLAEHALQKLQHLQAMIEETGTELRHVERLISKALLDSQSL